MQKQSVTDSGRTRIDFPEITIFFFGNKFFWLGGFLKGRLVKGETDLILKITELRTILQRESPNS
jgi:hypothetical protein